MGLDVYLYRFEDFAKAKATKEEFEKRTEPLWKDGISKEDREQFIDAIGAELGMVKGKYDWDPVGVTTIQRDSAKYPDHYFKVGYLRSSYNGGGINNVLQQRGVPGLYDIFEPNDRYEFVPDWQGAKWRVQMARTKMAEVMADVEGKHSVQFFGANMFASLDELPTDEATAMQIFKKEWLCKQDEPKSPFGDGYSNREGSFYMKDGLQVVAFIPGVQFKTPGVFAVTREKEGEGLQWYANALEITEEMIDYVLATGEPDKHVLHWSS